MTDDELRAMRSEMIAEYEKQWKSETVCDSTRIEEPAPNECGT